MRHLLASRGFTFMPQSQPGIDAIQANLIRTSLRHVNVDWLMEETCHRLMAREKKLAAFFHPIPSLPCRYLRFQLMRLTRQLPITPTNMVQVRSLGGHLAHIGVESRHFDLFASTLLDGLAIALGRRFAKDVRSAWESGLANIVSELKRGQGNVMHPPYWRRNSSSH